MNLLNNLECKAFEDEFQWVTAHNDWRIENIFTCGAFKMLNVMGNSRLIFTGKNKLSRLNIAAHEAGHAIVMAAAHGVVGEAVIDVKDHRGGVLGWVKRASAQEEKNESDYCLPKGQKFDMPCKPIVIMDLLILSAGFIGESFVGKKTGSNHEKFLIYCRCRHLDDLNEVEPLTNWNHYVEWCKKILLKNEALFWRVIDDLLANSEMTESVKILLHNRVKKEPTELFF